MSKAHAANLTASNWESVVFRALVPVYKLWRASPSARAVLRTTIQVRPVQQVPSKRTACASFRNYPLPHSHPLSI